MLSNKSSVIFNISLIDILGNIKVYASDKYLEANITKEIKDLKFDYYDSNEYYGLYRPQRLEVIGNGCYYEVYLTDCIASYWSNYSDTIDRCCINDAFLNSYNTIIPY